MEASVGDGKKDAVSFCMVHPAHMDNLVGGKFVVQQRHLVRGGKVVIVGGQKQNRLPRHIGGKGIDPVGLILIISVDDDGVVNLFGI